MILNNKQAQALIIILQDSLHLNIVPDPFCLDVETRRMLLNNILNQQTETLDTKEQP